MPPDVSFAPYVDEPANDWHRKIPSAGAGDYEWAADALAAERKKFDLEVTFAWTLADKPVFGVAGGALLVCLERELTLDLVRAMADRKPERVVCLDEGFAGNDQLKTNAVQTFKTKGVVFRTV